jgi:hypothetical protein
MIYTLIILFIFSSFVALIVFLSTYLIIKIISLTKPAAIPIKNFNSSAYINYESLEKDEGYAENLPTYGANTNHNDYFALMNKIFRSMQNQRFNESLQHCLNSLPYIPPFLKDSLDENGDLLVGNIPAIKHGLKISSFLRNEEAMNQIIHFVNNTPELRDLEYLTIKAQEDFVLTNLILLAVKKSPRIKQKDLKKITGYDGRTIANLNQWLNRAKLIEIKRVNEDLLLYLPRKE